MIRLPAFSLLRRSMICVWIPVLCGVVACGTGNSDPGEPADDTQPDPVADDDDAVNVDDDDTTEPVDPLVPNDDDDDDGSVGDIEPPDFIVPPSSGVLSAKGCGELADYILEQRVNEAYTWSRLYDYIAMISSSMIMGLSGSMNAGPGPSPGAPADPSATPEHSTTNVQVQGVDEGDLVKTDGRYLYAIQGRTIRVVQTVPVGTLEEVARIELETTPQEIYLDGNRLYVIETLGYQYYNDWIWFRQTGQAVEAYGGPQTRVETYSVADPENPVPIKRITLDGAFAHSRRIGDSLYLVHNFYLLSPDFPTMDWYSGGVSDERLEEFAEELSDEDLEHWLPSGQVEWFADGEWEVMHSGPLCGCDDVFLPHEPYGHGVAAVTGIDLKKPEASWSSQAIVTDPGLVYASMDALYIAARPWDNWVWMMLSWTGGDEEVPPIITELHRFEFMQEPTEAGAAPTGFRPPVYTANGSVIGNVLNQFSMDEYGGTLRVATTTGHVSRDPLPDVQLAHNHVFALQPVEDRLEIVGSVTGLAPGEKIYSARFIGERGYVVTFKKVDPLFTLDLSDPTEPRVVGELKIPGYSSYLHPLGENHLLAIGKHTEEAQTGDFAWYQGVQLSIFDVSDMANPQRTHNQIIGTRGTNSEAGFDHHAFNYYAPKGMLAIPISLWEGGDGGNSMGQPVFAGLQAWTVDLEDGFELAGEIDHSRFGPGQMDYYAYYSAPIRRSVFLGDTLLAVGNTALTCSALEDFTELATITW